MPCLSLHNPTSSTGNIGLLTQVTACRLSCWRRLLRTTTNDTHTTALVHTSPSRPAASGSLPLLATLGGSLLLGLAYSTDLPLLRWKRSPVLAAACILAVRCALECGDAGWCCDRGRQNLVVANVSRHGYRGCGCVLLRRWIQGGKPALLFLTTLHPLPLVCHPPCSTLQGGAGAAWLLLSHAASARLCCASHHAPHCLCHRLHAAVQVRELGSGWCTGSVWCTGHGLIGQLPCDHGQWCALHTVSGPCPCACHNHSLVCSVVIALFKDIPDVAGDSKVSGMCGCGVQECGPRSLPVPSARSTAHRHVMLCYGKPVVVLRCCACMHDPAAHASCPAASCLQAGVRTLSVRLGPPRVFWACIAILEAAYAGEREVAGCAVPPARFLHLALMCPCLPMLAAADAVSHLCHIACVTSEPEPLTHTPLLCRSHTGWPPIGPVVEPGSHNGGAPCAGCAAAVAGAADRPDQPKRNLPLLHVHVGPVLC